MEGDSMDDSEEHQSLLRDGTMRAQKLSTIDIRMPANWVGSSLQGPAKEQFLSLRRKIDLYNLETVTTGNLVMILDAIEEVKSSGNDRAVAVLGEVVNYLRTLLLSRDTEIVFHTLIFLDCIVKNSGFIMNVLIGGRKFMKTLSLIARRHLNESSQQHKRVGIFALDCLQAWGEAFYPRQEYYPHIYGTYLKLRTKYKVKFPRPDFDPTRVPIFLGVVSATERVIATKFNNEVRMQYGGVVGRQDSQDEEAEIAEAIAQSLADTAVPHNTIDYEPMRRFSEGAGRSKQPGLDSGKSQGAQETRDDDLEAAIRASLLETDLIDLRSTADSVQNSMPDSVWPEHVIAFDPWPAPASGQKALVQAQQSAPPPQPLSSASSVTDQILSLYGTPPTRQPASAAFPYSSAALPTFPASVQLTPQRASLTATWPPATPASASASASTTPATKWTPPVNPFDIYDVPTPLREPVQSKPNKAASAGPGKWELDGVWDLDQLATTIPHGKQKAPSIPDKPLKPFSAAFLPATPENVELEGAARGPQERSASAPPYPPPPPPPLFPVWSPETSVSQTSGEIADTFVSSAWPQLLRPARPVPPPPSSPPAPETASEEPGSFGAGHIEDWGPQSGPLPPLPLPPPPPPPPPPLPHADVNMMQKELWSPAGPVLMCDVLVGDIPAPPSFPPPAVPPPPPPVRSPTFPPEWSLLDSADMSDYVFDFEPAAAATDLAPAGGVPKLPPPPPGPTRTSWRPTLPAALAGPELAEAIQRTKAGLAHVESRPCASPSQSASGGPQGDILSFEPFKTAHAPSATPEVRVVPDPKPRAPPRKVGFIQPSADPDVEIRHYGTQRIIIRRPGANKK